jgi:hypothetical protein
MHRSSCIDSSLSQTARSCRRRRSASGRGRKGHPGSRISLDGELSDLYDIEVITRTRAIGRRVVASGWRIQRSTMLGKVSIRSHARKGGESAGFPRGNRAKQSQFVDVRGGCNRLSLMQLHYGKRDCPRPKTKPIFVVEIVWSRLDGVGLAGGLLAMTSRGTGLLPLRQQGGTCRTKPISGGAEFASSAQWERSYGRITFEACGPKQSQFWRYRRDA